jgi:predicted negative regulator of RcsB-dependent stress response
VKAWWAEHGKWVSNLISVVLIVISAYFGYKWWNNYQEEKAYALVQQLNAAVDTNNATEILKVANDLKTQYPNSTHTAVGILRAVQTLPAKNNNESIDLLKFVSSNPKQEEYVLLANYRLASILIDNKKFDEAIELMTKPVKDSPIWQGLFADRAADAYVAKGEKDKAKPLYEQALKSAQETQNKALQNFIELKMNVSTVTNN